MTEINKAILVDSNDNEYNDGYSGVSFSNNNPRLDKYFHCCSSKDAMRLRDMINDFVEEQHKYFHCCSSNKRNINFK